MNIQIFSAGEIQRQEYCSNIKFCLFLQRSSCFLPMGLLHTASVTCLIVPVEELFNTFIFTYLASRIHRSASCTSCKKGCFQFYDLTACTMKLHKWYPLPGFYLHSLNYRWLSEIDTTCNKISLALFADPFQCGPDLCCLKLRSGVGLGLLLLESVSEDEEDDLHIIIIPIQTSATDQILINKQAWSNFCTSPEFCSKTRQRV